MNTSIVILIIMCVALVIMTTMLGVLFIKKNTVNADLLFICGIVAILTVMLFIANHPY